MYWNISALAKRQIELQRFILETNAQPLDFGMILLSHHLIPVVYQVAYNNIVLYVEEYIKKH